MKNILLLCTCLYAGLLSFSQTNTSNMSHQTIPQKEFILLVRVPENYTTDNAIAVRQQWNALLDKWKADGTFITSYVYPTDGYLVSGTSGTSKTVTKEAVITRNLKLVSNMILRALNYEAVLELAKQCPILAQGGLIEVREIQPRPAPIQ